MAFVDCAVIILAHNGCTCTQLCLESILAAADQPRELFVVDNASADATPALLASMQPRFTAAGIAFTTWRNPTNIGCSAARNEAWRRVQSPYTVLLDNDAAVCTRDWLGRLRDLFSAQPSLAIVGPTLIYPFEPHLVQCAGVLLTPQGRVCFRGRGTARGALDMAPVLQPMHALISACWMMRTDLRDQLGMLDELFHPVQYEDLDLCLRANHAGWLVAHTPTVEMYHFEGTTTEAPGNVEYQRNIARNSLKFRQRWHQWLQQLDPAAVRPEQLHWTPRHELGLASCVHAPLGAAPITRI